MGIPKQALDAQKAGEQAIERASKPVKTDPPEVAIEVASPEAQAEPAIPAPEVSSPAAKPVSSTPDELAALREELNRERQLRRTIEGRLKSQLKPANDEIRQLRKELTETQESIKQMVAEGKKPGAERLLSEEEVSEMGDVLDLNTRMIKGVLEEQFESGELTKTIKALVAQSAEVRESQDQNSGPTAGFWEMVDEYAPGSRELNRSADERWLSFLDMYDGATGILNRELATEAMQNDDPLALASLFTDFMTQNGIVVDSSVTPQERTVRPEKAAATVVQPVLEKEGEDETFTEAEIKRFYEDVIKGKFKGREGEAEAIEKRIMAAAASGRVK